MQYKAYLLVVCLAAMVPARAGNLDLMQQKGINTIKQAEIYQTYDIRDDIYFRENFSILGDLISIEKTEVSSINIYYIKGLPSGAVRKLFIRPEDITSRVPKNPPEFAQTYLQHGEVPQEKLSFAINDIYNIRTNIETCSPDHSHNRLLIEIQYNNKRIVNILSGHRNLGPYLHGRIISGNIERCVSLNLSDIENMLKSHNIPVSLVSL